MSFIETVHSPIYQINIDDHMQDLDLLFILQ